MLRKFADKIVAVADDDTADFCNTFIKMNGTGEFVWNLLQSDVDFYAAHPNVTICAREQVSFNFLTENFKNQVLLLPDMAFYLDLKKYKVFEDENRVLYLKRTDKELVNANMVKIPANSEQHDWPTYENHYGEFDMVERFTHLLRIIFKICGLRDRILARLEDWKRNWYYRRKYVQMGVSFLSPYHTIYTTRLHVLILGVLLAKKIYLINNTSGKVVNFYNTWLNELDSIKKL